MVGVVTALLAALTSVASASTFYASASDNFGRNVSNGLGYANDGGRYTTKFSANATDVSVRSSATVVQFTKEGSAFMATLPRTKIGDTTVRTTTAITAMPKSGAGVYHSAIARQRGGYSYRATVRTSPNGASILWISRFDGSSKREARLGRTIKLPQKVTTRTQLKLELKVTGTTAVNVSSRAWKRGTTTPAFQTTAVDRSARRLATAGSVGISSYLSARSKSATIRFYDLTATKVAALATPTDPTAPSPTTTPGPTTAAPPVISISGRGSAAVGSASYAVPTGAIFVDASAYGPADGSESAPYPTLAQAVRDAEEDATIVLRAGTYHETVSTNYKSLTIQNYPKEAVWLDGSSVVGSWVKSGSHWVAGGWSAQFPSNASFSANKDQSSSFINSAYPMAAHPDQVFVNGNPLRQVASTSQVGPGTFAVDYAAKTLTIGDDPTGKSVRASDLQYGLRITGEESQLRGIGVRHYATPMAGAGGAVYVAGEGAGTQISNVVIEDNATQGLSIIRPDVTVKGVTVRNSGLMGIAATTSNRLVIRDSVVEGNNTEHFNVAPAAGGIKVTRQVGLTVTNNTISNNINSMGIWADESVTDIVVTKNTVENNYSVGIHLELSERGIVADNIASGNKTGIQIYNSGSVKIFNNYVGGNWSAGIKLMQDERRAASVASTDPRLGPKDPQVQWITRKITVGNNIFDAAGQYEFYAYDIRTGVQADDMATQIAGNLMAPVKSNTMFLWGLGSGKSSKYQTAEALTSAKGSAWANSTAASGSTEGGAVQSSAVAPHGTAIPLPSDVAAVTGQTTGSKRIGPFTTG